VEWCHLVQSQNSNFEFQAGSNDLPLKRVARFPKWHPELGRYYLVHTSQGLIHSLHTIAIWLIYIGNTERALLDGMKAFNGLEVERGVTAVAIDFDKSRLHDSQAHAIKLTVKHLTNEELAVTSKKDTNPQPGDFNYNPADEPYLKRKVTGKEGSAEVINAKFVIGADGSRSWTRTALGFDFVGDDGNDDESAGGILDCIATSNFRTKYLSNPLEYADQFDSGYSNSMHPFQGRAWSGIRAKGGRVVAYCSTRGWQIRGDSGKHHQVDEGDSFTV
jgi:hypothetical protein